MCFSYRPDTRMLWSLDGTSASLTPQPGPGASSPDCHTQGRSPACTDTVNKHSSFTHVIHPLFTLCTPSQTYMNRKASSFCPLIQFCLLCMRPYILKFCSENRKHKFFFPPVDSHSDHHNRIILNCGRFSYVLRVFEEVFFCCCFIWLAFRHE